MDNPNRNKSQELKKASTNLFVTATILWIIVAAWSVLKSTTGISNSEALSLKSIVIVMEIVTVIMGLSTYFIIFSALKKENEAHFMEFGIKKKLYRLLSSFVILDFILGFVLIFVVIFAALLTGSEGTATTEDARLLAGIISAVASILSNIFAVSNIIGIFALCIFKSTHIKLLKNMALIAFIITSFNLLLGIIYPIIQIYSLNQNIINVLSSPIFSFIMIIMYFAQLAFFVIRKKTLIMQRD